MPPLYIKKIGSQGEKCFTLTPVIISLYNNPIMSSKLILTNLSRHFNYAIFLDGCASGELSPLEPVTITIEPGTYELYFKDSDADNLPTTCKPICIIIEDSKILHLNVTTEDFSIRIYDVQGTHLNGKRGFLCGKISEGIRIENPIS